MHKIIEEDLMKIKEDLTEFKNKIEGKTFLVTGGAGFLGSWFCDVLITFEANVHCLDNFSSGNVKNIEHLLDSKFFNLIKGDVCNFSTNERFDYIVHMASIASPKLYQKHPLLTLDANVIGIRNMLELARKNDVKGFLFTSTSEVYGDSQTVPTPESYWGNVNPYGPRSCYDESKRCGEAYCFSYFQQYGVPIRISRIFNTYGPRIESGGYGRVVLKFIEQALSNKPFTVYGDGKQTRSFCYITDTTIGLFKLLLINGLNGEVVNIGNDKEIGIVDLANKIKEITNSNSQIIFEPLPKDDPRRRNPDLTKSRELLSYNPKIGLEAGLVRTIEWAESRFKK